MGLFRRYGGKSGKGKEGRAGHGEKRKEDISRVEIKGMIRKMRDWKAARMDEIPGEAWRYGEDDMERWIWDFCNRIWRERGGQRAGRKGL